MPLLNVFLENAKLSLLYANPHYKELNNQEDFLQILKPMKVAVIVYLTDVMTEAAELLLMIVKSYLHVVILLNHTDVELVFAKEINTTAYLIKI
jgi:hypothetical protein